MTLNVSEAQAVQDLIKFIRGGAYGETRAPGWDEAIRERATKALTLLSQRSVKTLGAGSEVDAEQATRILVVSDTALGDGRFSRVAPLPLTDANRAAIDEVLNNAIEAGHQIVAQSFSELGRLPDSPFLRPETLKKACELLSKGAAEDLANGYLGQAQLCATAAIVAKKAWIAARQEAMRQPHLSAVASSLANPLTVDPPTSLTVVPSSGLGL